MEEYGRFVLDTITKKNTLVEYETDGVHYVICECGEHAIFQWNIGTYYYICKCGWKSVCGITHPELFIGVERLRELELYHEKFK